MSGLAGPTGDDMLMKSLPLGLYAEKEEIGAMAAVLSGPLGAYVTGAQFLVDGGLSQVGSGEISDAVGRALFGEE